MPKAYMVSSVGSSDPSAKRLAVSLNRLLATYPQRDRCLIYTGVAIPTQILCPSWDTFVRHEFESEVPFLHLKNGSDVENKRATAGRRDFVDSGAWISARHTIRSRACDRPSVSSRSGKGEREK